MSKDVKTNVKPMCRNGGSCTHLVLGKCKFTHPAKATKIAPTHKQVVGKVKAQFSKAALSHHIMRINKLSQNITRVKAVADAFIDVKTGKSQSSWADASEIVDLQEQLVGLKSVARAAIGGQRIKAHLFVPLNALGSAATAIALSFPLRPVTSTEYASFASLYDEIKVTAVTVHALIGLNFASSSIPSGGAVWAAMGYDSTYDTTPTSATEVLESPQHQLHGVVPVFTGFTNDKPFKFEIKIPPGPVANAAAVTGGTGLIPNFPGEWMAIADTADSVGYFRLYIESGGASCILGYRLIFDYHCEFRERT